jgi:LuxR family maltose regulon positive regulatory protein
LAQGDLAAAAGWAHQRGLGPDDEPGYPREPEYLALARVLLAQDRPGPALALLKRLHAAAAAQRRTGSTIEILALLALASAAMGDEDAALSYLASALSLRLPTRLRPGVRRRRPADGRTAGPAVRSPAGRAGCLPAASRSATWTRVLRAFGGKEVVETAGRSTAQAVLGLVEQLTAREREVLVLLAAGAPNPRIAAELVVTLDTVKKHVSHLLGKLGAANRTEAVTRARQLGLIP